MAIMQDEWQSHRSDEDVMTQISRLMKHKTVWKELELDNLPIDKSDKGTNFLAGEIDMSEDYSLEVRNNEIRLSCMVWHFSNWDRLTNYLKKQGAFSADWISDEYVNPFDSF
jgi:hypothetical protein